jgi:hypothetical protein
VVRGANSPKISEVTAKQLAKERDVHEGNGERIAVCHSPTHTLASTPIAILLPLAGLNE